MYEDYMQNILGVPMRQYQNTYDERDFNPYWNYFDEEYRTMQCQNQMSCDELENCYPEIYNVIYPMVRKACSSNTLPITQSLIENIVNDISSNIEGNQFYEININLDNEVTQNREINKQTKTNSKQVENRGCENGNCNRQNRRNPLLNDLIRILVLRELLGRPGPIPRPGPRPPFPPNKPGPRPPFPPYRPW